MFLPTLTCFHAGSGSAMEKTTASYYNCAICKDHLMETNLVHNAFNHEPLHTGQHSTIMVGDRL
ncbi:hypothetical protein IEO21_01318 [Rhodonia placenta]|uniref:Uncharacterized protein n=1 Tax=Rhodonia placenta TaxID=104341 RepID=A0A8H7PAB6_9APHY|nr:hypothetical protein IEO21_01318 [Postia placenta]